MPKASDGKVRWVVVGMDGRYVSEARVFPETGNSLTGLTRGESVVNNHPQPRLVGGHHEATVGVRVAGRKLNPTPVVPIPKNTPENINNQRRSDNVSLATPAMTDRSKRLGTLPRSRCVFQAPKARAFSPTSNTGAPSGYRSTWGTAAFDLIVRIPRTPITNAANPQVPTAWWIAAYQPMKPRRMQMARLRDRHPLLV